MQTNNSLRSKFMKLFREDLSLSNKWWHRLFKVVFFIVTLLLIVGTPIGLYYGVPQNIKNTQITTNLVQFTQQHPEMMDTLPAFLVSPGELGCKKEQGKEYGYLSEYEIGKGVCNADILGNLDSLLNILGTKDVFNENWNTPLVKTYVTEAVEERKLVCLINSDYRDECPYENVVKYQRNILFLGQAFLYSLLVIAGWIIFWLLLYYHGFLYVVYGKKK